MALRLTLALLVLAAGCSDRNCCRGEFGVSYALVYGRVTSQAGTPIAGALVRDRMYLDSARTDASGSYRLSITAFALAPGDFPFALAFYRPGAMTTLVDSVVLTPIVRLSEAAATRDSTRVDVVIPDR